jgi:ATP-binding cassette subfamily B protein
MVYFIIQNVKQNLNLGGRMALIQLFKEARLSKIRIFLLVVFISLQILGTLYLPRLTADIINNGVAMGDPDYVLRTGILMLGVAVMTGIASILGTYFSAWVSTTFSRNVRKKLFGQTQRLSYQDFKHFNSSSLITRATNDIEQVQNTVSLFFQMLLPAPFVVVVGMFLSYRSDPYMALIVTIASTFMLIIVGLIAVKVIPLFTKVQTGLDKMNDKVKQYLTGIRVVRAFNRTKLETEDMNAAFGDYAKLNIRINRIFAMLMPFIMLVMNFAIVSILWFGGHRIASGSMQVGDIMAIIEYSMNIIFYLLMAVFSFIFIPRAMVCSKRINEVMNYNPEITDGTNKINEQDKLRFEFKDVSFRYQDAENPVLNDLSFTCEAGTTTAIIGGTGSGKSTIARLVPRLLDTTSGHILLNGVNIKELPQDELRKKIGFVPQQAFLFNGTIADNLRHGNENATLEDMKQAAKLAQAEDFINVLDKKYEAPVLQGARNFSGGQRQRLSIARMLMKKPQIYVFDDSFSALDYKTDAALRRALKDTTGDSIVITIAQRLTTIKGADQILVVDEGTIVGRGTHKELLKNCETYLEIAKSQLSEEELANELG